MVSFVYFQSVIHCFFSSPCLILSRFLDWLFSYSLIEQLILLQILMSVLWEDIPATQARTVTTQSDPIAVWSIVELAFEEHLMG